MDNKVQYTKLSALVDGQFTIQEVGPYVFKQWDNEARKMLTSPSYQAGYRKLYPVTTDKGLMDLGPGQLGNLLETVFNNGKADLVNKTFQVKSNGKSGLDIRYFFNLVREPEPEPEFEDTEPFNEEIPFD